MKNSHKCAKCDSTDMAKVPGSINYTTSNAIEVGLASYVMVTRYVCTSCGFSEEWIDSEIDRKRLKKRYGS